MDIRYPLYLLECVASAFIFASWSKAYAPSRVPLKDLEDFDIDLKTGFFPPEPLPHLSGIFHIWEEALEQASDVLALAFNDSEEAMEKKEEGHQWRQKIRDWPILNTASLHQNKMLVKRAHMVLAWLAHFYVHSMPKSSDSAVKRIPSSIAVPLVQISGVLKTAPALTFADTVLWNLEPIHQNVSFSIDNCRVVNCFSGTEDERNFYLVSAQVEFRGTEALSIINRYLRIADHSDGSSHHILARDLMRLTEIIEDFVELLKSLRELVEPKVFYWAVRPWYKGSGDNGTAWELEGVSGFETLELNGPSAGQSSVMHAIDAFLDIDHKLVYNRCPIPSVNNLQADLGFMERMRRYMPGQHQDFLSCIDQAPSLRELAQRKASLREPYNKAVNALKRLRDLHIRFVCLCIVSMAKSSPPAGWIVNQEEFGCKTDAIRGTSGSNVSTLLKAGRDSTRRAMIESN